MSRSRQSSDRRVSSGTGCGCANGEREERLPVLAPQRHLDQTAVLELLAAAIGAGIVARNVTKGIVRWDAVSPAGEKGRTVGRRHHRRRLRVPPIVLPGQQSAPARSPSGTLRRPGPPLPACRDQISTVLRSLLHPRFLSQRREGGGASPRFPIDHDRQTKSRRCERFLLDCFLLCRQGQRVTGSSVDVRRQPAR